MEKQKKYFQMETCIKEIIEKESQMEKENIHGKIK